MHETIHDGRSPSGRRVTMTVDQADTPGAKLIYTVTRYRASSITPDQQLVTRFEDRAELRYAAYLLDITDPTELQAFTGDPEP
jgi:hypothetical protein